MNEIKFTSQQLSWFTRYEAVRDSGKWNMFDRNAQVAAGLAPEEYTFVMTNYSEMAAQIAEAN